MVCKVYKYNPTAATGANCLEEVTSSNGTMYTCDQLLAGVFKKHAERYNNFVSRVPYNPGYVSGCPIYGCSCGFSPCRYGGVVLNTSRLPFASPYQYGRWAGYSNYPIMRQMEIANKFNTKLFNEILTKYPPYSVYPNSYPNIVVATPYGLSSRVGYGFYGGDVRTYNGVLLSSGRIVIDPFPKTRVVSYNTKEYKITYYYSEEISGDKNRQDYIYVVANEELPKDAGFCDQLKKQIQSEPNIQRASYY
jgi:hypothetical protein